MRNSHIHVGHIQLTLVIFPGAVMEFPRWLMVKLLGRMFPLSEHAYLILVIQVQVLFVIRLQLSSVVLSQAEPVLHYAVIFQELY